MVANTLFNDLAGCPFSFHKLQVDPLAISAEVVTFRQKNSKDRPPRS